MIPTDDDIFLKYSCLYKSTLLCLDENCRRLKFRSHCIVSETIEIVICVKTTN